MKNLSHPTLLQTEGDQALVGRILERSPVGLVYLDAEGRVSYANNQARDLVREIGPGATLDSCFSHLRITDIEGNALEPRQLALQSLIERTQDLSDCVFLANWPEGRKPDLAVRFNLIQEPSGAVSGAVVAIEDMSLLSDGQEQTRQNEKIDTIGQFAKGIAHDFNNVLAAVRLHVGLLHKTPELTTASKELIKEIERQTLRAADLTRYTLLFSRPEEIRIKPTDLGEVLRKLSQALERLGENISVNFVSEGKGVWALADSASLEQVIMNLCLNARDAMRGGGRLELEVRTVAVQAAKASSPEARDGTFALLSISDSGCGIEPGVLKRIFEPFFTTKENGKSLGIGLAVVDRIVKQHQGWIEVESTVGRGSTFRIYLPSSTAQKPEPPAAALEMPGGTETILLVEDEIPLRRMESLWLRKLGYAVLEASDGIEAQGLWKEHQDKIELLFTDTSMPRGIDGIELASRLKAEKPSLKVIVSSGSKTDAKLLGGQGFFYLPKPYETITLASIVRYCLDKP